MNDESVMQLSLIFRSNEKAVFWVTAPLWTNYYALFKIKIYKKDNPFNKMAIKINILMECYTPKMNISQIKKNLIQDFGAAKNILDENTFSLRYF